MNKCWRQPGALFTVVLPLIALAVIGCNVVLPAHPHSLAIEGEEVQIKMLNVDGMEPYKEDFKAAFGNYPKEVYNSQVEIGCNSGDRAIALLAPLALAAVNAAIGWVTNSLAAESDRYVAQFGYAAALDQFWEKPSCGTNDFWVPHYYGLEMNRLVDPCRTNAFHLVCGICPSHDGTMFQIKPLIYRSPRSKAKVLSDNGWTNWMLWKWFWSPTHEVKTVVAVEIDSAWVNASRQYQTATIAAFPLDLGSYNINSNTDISLSERNVQTSGWFPGIPRSSVYDVHDAKLKYSGTFTLKLIVTQTDPSNAKKLVKQASELVTSKRTEIIAIVTNGMSSANSN